MKRRIYQIFGPTKSGRNASFNRTSWTQCSFVNGFRGFAGGGVEQHLEEARGKGRRRGRRRSSGGEERRTGGEEVFYFKNLIESGGRGGGANLVFEKVPKTNGHCSWFRIEIRVCKIPFYSRFISEYFLWPAAPPCRARLVLVLNSLWQVFNSL